MYAVGQIILSFRESQNKPPGARKATPWYTSFQDLFYLLSNEYIKHEYLKINKRISSPENIIK